MKFSYVSLFSLFLILILFDPCSFADDITWSRLDFHIDFSNIFTQHAKTDELYTSHKTDHTDRTCPSGHSSAADLCNDRPQNANKTEIITNNTSGLSQP